MDQIDMTPEDMIKILKDKDFENALKFVQVGSLLNCKAAIRYATAHKSWKCVYSKRKPKRVLFTIECDEDKWSIKANLFHIDQYKESVESCSDNIKNAIKSAYDCRMCSSRCKGGAQFTIDNQQFVKCIGCCFYFRNLPDEEWDCIRSLIEMESNY